GMIHQALGDIPTARTYLERALRIWTATLGPDHPHTRTVAANLGRPPHRKVTSTPVDFHNPLGYSSEVQIYQGVGVSLLAQSPT
ncbi:MAG: tetratricopeptide repeat protein, partial [Bryobacterales bacterium]|nr:tetratricopeptide repeat protein [Bryobacterales bacterium]